jgi:dienelactone hydrolase
MKLYFNLPEFDGQLVRVISYAYYQGADIGECLATAAKIKEGDFNSWFEEWFRIGEDVKKIGETAEQQGHFVSASEAYLRASNYYRTAMFFLYGYPVDVRLIHAYDCHAALFAKGTSIFSIPPEEVQIPFEGTTLTGYFYKAHLQSGRSPTLIANSGYDGTHQENYFFIAAAALKRGYHVLCFDGPGQGSALIKQQLYMRPNWETVITPVIDFLLERPDVDHSQIGLYGISWGGYLASRAACYEHRLAALIANPGQYRALQGVETFLPNIEELIHQEAKLQSIAHAITQKPMMAAKLNSKMWVHGIKTPSQLLKAWKEYSLEGLANQIQCPTLVMDAENEPFSQGQAKRLFDALQCPKDYLLLTNAEGAGEHCGGCAVGAVTPKILDWLGHTIKSTIKTIKR